MMKEQRMKDIRKRQCLTKLTGLLRQARTIGLSCLTYFDSPFACRLDGILDLIDMRYAISCMQVASLGERGDALSMRS